MADQVTQILTLAWRYTKEARDEATANGEPGIAEGCQASADALAMLIEARARKVYLGHGSSVRVSA